MFQTLFGVNMSIFMGAMAPGSEVTFFLVGTSVSTPSVTIQSRKISISVIALFVANLCGGGLKGRSRTTYNMT